MDSLVDKLDWLGAGVGGLLGWFFGGFDGLLYALFTLTVADYVTGMIKAWIKRELSSETGAKGIAKKVYIFILVGAANVVDRQIMPGGSDVLRDAVIFYYAINELVSLTENAKEIGLPMPKFLTDKLAQFQEAPQKKTRKAVSTDSREQTSQDRM